MPLISSKDWASLHHGKTGKPWSVQYANRRLRDLGVRRDKDGRFDYVTAESLHNGDLPIVARAEDAKSGPVLVRREPVGENLEEISKNDAEKRLTIAKARKAEAELAEAEGKLLDADGARKIFAAVGRMHAQGRENVPAQLAPKLVGKTDLNEIEAILRATLREMDTGVANEITSRYPEMAGAGVTELAG